jgi:hypothetical protein
LEESRLKGICSVLYLCSIMEYFEPVHLKN